MFSVRNTRRRQRQGDRCEQACRRLHCRRATSTQHVAHRELLVIVVSPPPFPLVIDTATGSTCALVHFRQLSRLTTTQEHQEKPCKSRNTVVGNPAGSSFSPTRRVIPSLRTVVLRGDDQIRGGRSVFSATAKVRCSPL